MNYAILHRQIHKSIQMIIEYGIFNKAILWFQPRGFFRFTIFEIIQL